MIETATEFWMFIGALVVAGGVFMKFTLGLINRIMKR